MITSVTIESFRGIREGGVDGLAPISILVGPNNAGKSTVLEAIAVLGLAPDARAVASLLMRRGGPALDALVRALSRGAKHAHVASKVQYGDQENEWTAKISAGVQKTLSFVDEARSEGLHDPMDALRVDMARPPRFESATVYVDAEGRLSENFDDHHRSDGDSLATRFVDVEAVRSAGALEDAYTRIDEARQLHGLLKSMARSMPGLSDLRILKLGSDFVLHTFCASEPPVPAYLAGDGFKRLLTLAAAVLGTPKGVVLLEEPESFQHPRYLEELASLLHLTAREGTQIILSTHSIELIDLLLHAPEAEGRTYPAVHRMSLYEGKLRATTLDRERALTARESLYTDLRA